MYIYMYASSKMDRGGGGTARGRGLNNFSLIFRN